MTVGDKTSTRVSQLEVGNEDHTRTFKYWYDPLGNISWTQDDSNTADCFYDLKGQLTSGYSYDNVTSDGVEFEYDGKICNFKKRV